MSPKQLCMVAPHVGAGPALPLHVVLAGEGEDVAVALVDAAVPALLHRRRLLQLSLTVPSGRTRTVVLPVTQSFKVSFFESSLSSFATGASPMLKALFTPEMCCLHRSFM